MHWLIHQSCSDLYSWWRSTDWNVLYPMEVNTALKTHKHALHLWFILILINVLYLIICCIEYYNKKGHPLRVEDTYIWRVLQGLSTETVYLHHSTNAEGMHYSSWGVSRESQSSPLRFFVESNATDHQEVSSFFSEKKSVLSWRRTRDLEPRIVSPDHSATVTYLFYYYYLHNI